MTMLLCFSFSQISILPPMLFVQNRVQSRQFGELRYFLLQAQPRTTWTLCLWHSSHYTVVSHKASVLRNGTSGQMHLPMLSIICATINPTDFWPRCIMAWSTVFVDSIFGTNAFQMSSVGLQPEWSCEQEYHNLVLMLTLETMWHDPHGH